MAGRDWGCWAHNGVVAKRNASVAVGASGRCTVNPFLYLSVETVRVRHAAGPSVREETMFASAPATALTALAALTLAASTGWAQNVSMTSLLAADRAAAERSLRDGAAPALMAVLAP